jgi:endonuclease/exonuclease/phosphatase family metal-dependent hydrolase
MKSVLSKDNTSSNSRKPHPTSSCSKKDRSERTEFHAIPEPPLIPRQHQTTLQWAPTGPNTTDSRKNIPPAGDSIVQRKQNDGIFRVASNNIDGSTFNKGGFDIAQDISVSDELGIDVMALQETKVPWTGANRRLYDMQTKLMWPTGAKTAFSSAPWEHGDSTYQAGGTLISTHGQHVGRIVEQGADPHGRFCWQKMLGSRGEGVAFMSGYRVCHNLEDNPGPFTQFHQERNGLRSAGIKNPVPRKQFFKDMLELIDKFRLEGFRPVLMMDANEDWVARSHPREKDALMKFMRDAQLIDPFFEKFKVAPRTYVEGRHRLDYILIDPALSDAVQRVGYLGNHDGNKSDHTMAFIDFNAKRLFRGIIHRPTEIHSREFMIEQDDKKLIFTCIARTKFNAHKIPERVFKLVADFAVHGATKQNI